MHGPVPQASPPQPQVSHSITSDGTPSVHARRRTCCSSISSTASSLLTPVGSVHSLGPTECTERASGASWRRAQAAELQQTRDTLFGTFSTLLAHILAQRASNQPPAGPPATIQTRVQSAPPARLPEALRRWSTNHRGSSDKSTYTHARDTSVTPAGVPSAIHKALLSRHTGIGWSGGGGGSGTRGRTGSDGAEQRPPGRPLLRLPRARRLRSSSAVRRREAWRRGDARRRWRAGERPARGEADR